MTADHCQKDSIFDEVFLLCKNLFSFGVPTQFEFVFELNEGGLFDVELQSVVVDDLHHGY